MEASPEDGGFHMNLAVTQMRVGLLDDARKSFKKARDFMIPGQDPTQLKDNLKALKDHEKFSKSIDHDTSQMYEQYRKQAEGEDGSASDDEEDEDEVRMP